MYYRYGSILSEQQKQRVWLNLIMTCYYYCYYYNHDVLLLWLLTVDAHLNLLDRSPYSVRLPEDSITRLRGIKERWILLASLSENESEEESKINIRT